MISAMNNAIMTEYLGHIPLPFSSDHFNDSYHLNRKKFKNQSQLLFIIVQKQLNTQIGCITLHMIPECENCCVGYWILPAFWNKGYMSEAFRNVIEYGFNKLKIHKIYAVCVEYNLSSEKVMQKCGLKLEGVLTDDLKLRGKYYTLKRYALLRSQYAIKQI